MGLILQYIHSSSVLLPFIAIIIGKIKYNKESNLQIKLFFIYLLATVILQTIIVVFQILNMNNLIFAMIYLVCELPLLGLIILSLFVKDKWVSWKTFVSLLSIPLITNIIFFDLSIAPYRTIIINSLILFVISVVALRKVKLVKDDKTNEWYYYILLGMIIYTLNSVLVYGFVSLGLYFPYHIHGVVALIQNILFMIGVMVYNKSGQPQNTSNA